MLEQTLSRLPRASLKLILSLFLHYLLAAAFPSSSNFTDQQSLLAFKSQIIGNSSLATNWTQSTNFCHWVGVSCSERRQRVTSLRLVGMGLGGTMSPHIGNLSFLTVLDLSNNSFHGRIVHELGYLHRLKRLILQDTNFEGLIPPSLGNCQHLEAISLISNKLVGPIPQELSTLPRLQILLLTHNNLTGTIPSSLGNLSALETLRLGFNSLHGNIPYHIASIKSLKVISTSMNHLSGPIPPHLFNVSSLEAISFEGNAQLSGELPPDTGLRLPNLQLFYLGGNQVTGKIPLYISNSSMLQLLDLSYNAFTGPVPTGLDKLESLTILGFGWNRLSGDLTFLKSLTRLRSLRLLNIAENQFNGDLPYSFGNLSSTLETFVASNCKIKGRIPESIGSLTSLNHLILSKNNLSGKIPSSVKGLESLQRLYLDSNSLEDSIPDEICLLNNLGEINLENNLLSGPLPSCIGNLSLLQALFLNSNKLNSMIPSSLWSLDNLLFMDLSSNSLHGDFNPEFGGLLKSLGSIDLSWNQISGKIPGSLGSLQSLSALNLSHNSFRGPIPESLGKLIALDDMDLSYNDLSGPIPKSLEAITHLKHLNLSNNKLSGEIPSGGPFANLTVQSFLENEQLCGHSVSRPCKGHESRKPGKKVRVWIYIVPSILAALVAFGVSAYMLKRQRGKSGQTLQSSTSGKILLQLEPKMFSYQELCRATNNFCEANLLGMGSFGSVYKGVLTDGGVVAVKVLNLLVEGALKSFDAECKVLRAVRHRNLVKVISSCTNPDLRALVLEYMSNGSLHKWLYSHNYFLNLHQRVSIMRDVALALEYLHHGQEEPVIHCDLKPSNVLLDEDMVSHVGDFGIAKILAGNNTSAQTNTLGTFGYIAPEYGADGRVSAKGDIYSYGIMLLETFTRKGPTDEMFVGDLSIRKWVSASIPDQITEVVDKNLLKPGQKGITDVVGNNLLAILHLGMECCHEVPEKRSDIKDVVIKLNKIKLQILSEEGHG